MGPAVQLPPNPTLTRNHLWVPNAAQATDVGVQNALNQFNMLSNTQFIENRVADDEEQAEPEPEPEIQPPMTTEEKIKKYSDAVGVGMTAMRSSTFWATIEQQGAVESAVSNPYMKRPLPYVIGTAEYHDDDKCGLDYEEIIDDVSDSDSDLSSDFSESSDGELSDDDSDT